MKQIKKSLRLNKDEYYETHLAIINCILPVKLTPTEIKVLSGFMSLTGDIAKDRFGASARKLLKRKFNLSSAGMSNYLKAFRDKGFIYDIEGDTTILPLLFPEHEEQQYFFKLVNDDI